MIGWVNALIDSHFSDFYLNKNLQFLLQKIEEQIDLLKVQKGLIQEVKIIDIMQKKQIILSEEQANPNKDLNPEQLSHEILYF